MMRLAGKRCLIVGGTSGLGLAAATRFVQEGARLVVADLSEATLPEGALFVTCDATQPGAVEKLFQETLGHLGGIDALSRRRR